MWQSKSRDRFSVQSFSTTLATDLSPWLPDMGLPGIGFEDLYIKTKEESLIPLNPNEVQAYYLDTVFPNWRQGDITAQGLRENILKFRQPGFSTIIEALIYRWVTSRKYFKAWIVAGDNDGADLLFEMIQRFYENDSRKLVTKYSNRQELYFADLDSSISVHTAGKVRLGRGTTINALHMSELAWWDNLNVRGGLLQAVPLHGNVFEETTAKGFNAYQKKYQADKRGKTNFRAWFFPWSMFRQYSVAVPADYQRTPEEQTLVENYHLTDGQIMWRRGKKLELDGTPTPFEQEYPLNDVEAFVASGHSYFDKKQMQLLYDSMQGPEFDPISDLVIQEDYPRLRSAYAAGHLKIWKLPERGHHYIIPADTAEGQDPDDGDYQCADVLDAQTWEQVAQVCARIDMGDFGKLLCELGYAYNTALVAPERNNTGYAVIGAMHDAQYPAQRGNGLSGLYYHDPDAVAEKRNSRMQSRKAGWPENERERRFALDKLLSAVTNGDITINCRETVEEMIRFVRIDGGKVQAESGAHDDRVLSLAIGCALLNLRFERMHKVDDTEIPVAEPQAGYGTRRGGR